MRSAVHGRGRGPGLCEMPLIRMICWRSLGGAATILAMSVVVFAMTEFLPGDAATALLGQSATPEALKVLREQLGLNDPVYVRYLRWLGDILTGDLGESLMRGSEVSDLMAARGYATLLISGVTIALTVPIAISLGIVAAYYADSRPDRLISSVCLVGISMPEFLVALILVTMFAIHLGWFPSTVGTRFDESLGRLAWSLALPVLALLVTNLAYMARMTRNAVLNVLGSPAIEMAILKGVPSQRIILRHALPNAIGPIASVVALETAHLITGIVVLEAIFNINGLGRLMVDAVGSRDIPVVQACALIFCVLYVLLNLMADIVSLMANPRIRFPK